MILFKRCFLFIPILIAIAVLLLLTGCNHEQVKKKTPAPVKEIKAVAITDEKNIETEEKKGPKFVNHIWKNDDSLIFLSLFYSGKPDKTGIITETNPEVDFSQIIEPGTSVYIPESIILPELKDKFTYVIIINKDKPELTAKQTDLNDDKILQEQDLGGTQITPSVMVDSLKIVYKSSRVLKPKHKVSSKRKINN